MKYCICCMLLQWSFLTCHVQKPFGTERLQLEKEITLLGVKGRIDHMAINLQAKVIYLAALGNNSVEVIDLDKGAVIQSIKGIEGPQGIAYLPEQNEIAVASGGTGDCIFYNAATFQKVAMVHLPGDADNIRYDSTERKMYVGYGNGSIALIDPVAHKQTGAVKLPAHPESFQLDKKNSKLYVNLPDAQSIAMIDLKNFTIAHMWSTNPYRGNFPMVLDTANNLVFVGYRRPAVLVGYDGRTGKQVATNELVGDVDDLFYNSGKGEILASGGGGAINIFKKGGGYISEKVANIPTRQGARTSLFLPTLRILILAQRASGGKEAALAVYTLND